VKQETKDTNIDTRLEISTTEEIRKTEIEHIHLHLCNDSQHTKAL